MTWFHILKQRISSRFWFIDTASNQCCYDEAIDGNNTRHDDGNDGLHNQLRSHHSHRRNSSSRLRCAICCTECCKQMHIEALSKISPRSLHIHVDVTYSCQVEFSNRYKPCTGTTATPSMHRLQSASADWLLTNLYSLEVVYSHLVRRVTVMASRKWLFVIYWALSWRFWRPLSDFDAGVWSLAFCEFYLTCRLSAYKVRNKRFSSDIISVTHFDYMGPVCGLLYGRCGSGVDGVAGAWFEEGGCWMGKVQIIQGGVWCNCCDMVLKFVL